MPRTAPMLLLTAALALAGCDSPSVGLMGAQKTQVTIGGSRFSVHWRNDRAEAYRVSVEYLPDGAEILARAEQAIIQATGCQIRKGSLAGDVALIKARLDC